MREHLHSLFLVAGAVQLLVLVASFSTPRVLRWREELASLPRLHRQLFWIYGGYIVMSIVTLALACLLLSGELASGGPLARAVCAYGAAFWGVRVGLQAVLDVRPFLTSAALRAGYHGLTVAFAALAVVYGAGALAS